MDTHITSLSPEPPHLDPVSRPRAALPGEATEPHAATPHATGPADSAEQPSGSAFAGKTPAKLRGHGRTALWAGAAVLVVAGAGGAFLLSPYNHVVPADTARLGAQARQLAASAGLLPPVVAPAAKLATAPRPEAKPVYRDAVTPAEPDEQVAEIQGFRSGATARAGGPAATAVAAEVGTASAPRPPVPPIPVAAPVAPPSAAGAVEAGAAPVAAQTAPTAPVPAPAPTVSAPALEVGLAPQPAAPPPLPATTAGASEPITAAGIASAATRVHPAPAAAAPPRPTPAPADPAAVAIELRPAPMARGEQIEVLNLVAQLGVVVRDLRSENAALRARVQASTEKVDGAVADFERRLALAEARGAINAAMGADPGATQAGTATAALAPAPASASRTTHLSGAPIAQPVSFQVSGTQAQAATAPAAAPAASGPRRYKVQAASPGLAMLSELDRSGGEGSQLQVGVGDPVPGYGKITAIQQQGAAWVVKTDRGTIQ